MLPLLRRIAMLTVTAPTAISGNRTEDRHGRPDDPFVGWAVGAVVAWDCVGAGDAATLVPG